LRSNAAVAYGGLEFATPRAREGSAVQLDYNWSDGLNNSLINPFNRGYHRLTIQAHPGEGTYLIDGRVVDVVKSPAPSSPWLTLVALGNQTTVFRNPRLTGKPTIPREISLVNGDQLEGWSASFFNESISLDPGFVEAHQRDPRRGPGARVATRNAKPVDEILEQFDWAAREGVIHGRRQVEMGAGNSWYDSRFDTDRGVQSSLIYDRALEDGDVVSYEFYHEPEEFMVHPSVGRVAYLIEPNGLELHWLTGPGDHARGVDSTNRALDPGLKIHTPRPNLKPRAWNSMTVAIEKGAVHLNLNGQKLASGTLDSGPKPIFGLYHDRFREAVKVRNITLKGRWPERLPDAMIADLTQLAPGTADSLADRKARYDLLGAEALGRSAGLVLAETAGLTAEKRYQKPAEWVLPAPGRSLPRLHGTFTPTYPINSDQARATADQPDLGGRLAAPALELLDLAGQLHKLDEVANALKPCAQTREGLALQSLIALHRGDSATAAKLLEQLKTGDFQRSTEDWPDSDWAELIAASRALEQPACRVASITLLQQLAEHARQANEAIEGKLRGDEAWTRQIARLLAWTRQLDLVQNHQLTQVWDDSPARSAWAASSVATAFTRSHGFPAPLWTLSQGTIAHQAGHNLDLLYFKTPLSGDFELSCEITVARGARIGVMYAGHLIQLPEDGKSIERSRFGDAPSLQTIIPPLKSKGPRHTLRFTVKDRQMVVFVDDQRVLGTPRPPDGDP